MLIVGSNPRKEAPVLNARIRKRWLASAMPIGLIGSETDLTYATHQLGTAPSVLAALHDGSHDFAKVLRDAKQPMIIVGQGALARPDGAAVLAACLAPGGGDRRADAGLARLQRAAHRGGARRRAGSRFRSRRRMARASPHMLGGGVDVLWLLGADEFDTARIGADTFVIYQGHHGDAGARARRRDPARRRLHRKARHLCQHRRPRAARLPCGLSAGRGARGLDDPARLQRRSSANACPTTRSRRCARGWSR